ncbi:lycopene cyclase family protein [Candidatus Puniceispirillum sp.]|nr:lycopene cyclase family protein [Candidatus Puniceispirillum sp.]
MSNNAPKDMAHPMAVDCLGAGCASLSLAARASEFANHHFNIIDPETHKVDDHIWGFWAMPWLNSATDGARKQWFKWRIISTDRMIEKSSQDHPYSAIHRYEWLEKCRKKALAAGVSFRPKPARKQVLQILDSRPPPMKDGVMLQHFSGYEITADHDVFDSTTAILMDFRCDQSRGIHFIYCLPFSARDALVESTLFSPELAPKPFYDSAIRRYLKEIIGIDDYRITRREKGVIPMATLPQRDPHLTGIGANGGAIRPSSGYAFSFIQKQIDQIMASAKPGQPLTVKAPHSRFELFMDGVFLRVIRRHPALAPQIFTAMADRLTGDEFALFLSGEAGPHLWTKLVLAMPKWPFLCALFQSDKVGKP